jgi:hypothetical protein
VIVGSDSGRIVILEYNKEKNAFDKIHQETFGKSGCRRIVPGQVKWSPDCCYHLLLWCRLLGPSSVR